MRTVNTTETARSLTREVQDYLFPSSKIKLNTIIVVPYGHYLWAGSVFRTNWGNPRKNYNELLDMTDKFVSMFTTISMPIQLALYYKLYEFYWQGKVVDNRVGIEIMDQHKFVVQWPYGYSVRDSKIMRPGNLGVLRVEESLEHFKHHRIGIPHDLL